MHGIEADHQKSEVCAAQMRYIWNQGPKSVNPTKISLESVISETDSSLLDTGELNFYLLNRGILLSAKDVSFNNYSNELTISFENCEVHGNVDGGHTYRTILQYRDQLD